MPAYHSKWNLEDLGLFSASDQLETLWIINKKRRKKYSEMLTTMTGISQSWEACDPQRVTVNDNVS